MEWLEKVLWSIQPQRIWTNWLRFANLEALREGKLPELYCNLDNVTLFADDVFLVNFAGVAVARTTVVVRAEEVAAAPAAKPQVGPKRGSQVSHSGSSQKGHEQLA